MVRRILLVRIRLHPPVTHVTQKFKGTAQKKGESLMQIKIFKNLKQYTLTSTLKKEDIELVKKYRPGVLKKKDNDGNDIFAMSYIEGKPCVAANGITFGAADVDSGCAMIIGNLPETLPENTTAGDYIADKVGSALEFVNEFEATISEVAAAIKYERAELIGSITEI